MTARALVVTLLALLPIAVAAQYSIGSLAPPLTIPRAEGASPCSRTGYDPDVHVTPDGDLGLIAQSFAPTPCALGSVDMFQGATRDRSSGGWRLPSLVGSMNECPVLQGQYERCGFEPGLDAGPIASPSVVRLENPNSPTGVRYYMAFVGGNADFINGKIYWAVSDDAKWWTVYARNTNEYWAPVIAAKYVRSEESPRSTPACAAPSGIGQVQLAFEDGRFYVFFQYWHPVQPECEEGRDTPACAASPWKTYDRGLSSVLYRFDYDPKHPFGFGPSVREVYLDGGWQRHDAMLVWGYDVDVDGEHLRTEGGTPVMELYNGVQAAGFGFGAGDVKFGNGRWLHVYEFEGITRAQTAESLDPTVATWTAPERVDTTPVTQTYPLATFEIASGLWYGSLAGSPDKWWIWMPVPTEAQCGSPERPNVFGALSLLPAELCTPDRPCS